VTWLTEFPVHSLFNGSSAGEMNIAVEAKEPIETDSPKGQPMSPSILIAAIFLTGAVSALRDRGHNDLITPRPYNNRHSDATAARDERTLLS
jgi:hypothetical protein